MLRLAHLGGEVRPMGRVTGTFYRLYGRAKEGVEPSFERPR
ncbi:hypothetical protein WME94_28690 [Sorangium sp. So ce429]